MITSLKYTGYSDLVLVQISRKKACPWCMAANGIGHRALAAISAETMFETHNISPDMLVTRPRVLTP